MKTSNKCYFLLVVIFFVQSFARLVATELPVFYRAPFFRPIQDKPADWKTQATVRVGAGDTHHGWGLDDKHCELFSIYGTTDVTKLGFGLEGLGDTSPAKPTTSEFWKTGGTFNPSTPLVLAGQDGQIELSGKLKVEELAFTIKQSIFSGFYVQLHAPLRHVKIDQIEATNLGAETVAGYNMQTFLNTDLPKILEENKYKNFTTFKENKFKNTDVPEFLVSLGWQGQADQNIGIVDKIRGFMQAGLLFPSGSKKNEDLLFAIPLGYNKFWGVNCQLGAEVAFWKFVVLGASVGTTIFLSEVRDLRMQSDERQTGWFMLGKGRAKVDQGSMWDMTGYVKADHVFANISFLTGYSFNRQEDTQLLVRDDNFMKTVVAESKEMTPPVYISKDHTVNSDERLRGWSQHVFHVMAEYSAAEDTKSWFAPIVRLEYSHPFAGRRTFSTEMLGGTLGLQVQWAV